MATMSMDQQECENREVWVTGAGGLIGHYIADTLSRRFPFAQVVPLTRSMLDLTDFARVTELFTSRKPAFVFHCAAMSRSPECEASPALAQKLNVEVTAHLASLAAESGFVFFSSDQVFDGRGAPYREDSPVNPLSVYARTKVEAERIVLANPRHLVIRTSLNAGTSPTGDRGINEQMRIAWRAGKELVLFTDEFRCPIHAAETAEATCELAFKGCTGVYHVAGAQRMSRFALGELLAMCCPELNPRMRPAALNTYEGPPRPPDLEMDCSKANSQLSRPLQGLPAWILRNPKEVL